MVKKLIIAIIVIIIFLIAISSYIPGLLVETPGMEGLRLIRDQVKEILRTSERSIGISSDAKIVEQNFIVEEYVTGLSTPTTMTFIGDDILILEKNYGKVKLLRDGEVRDELVLDLAVSNNNEQGTLGIINVNSDVYIFFTESEEDDGEPIANNIYRYKWNGDYLVEPVLVTSLPSFGDWHNGGALTKDMEGNIFAVIGDQMGFGSIKNEYSSLQNAKNDVIDDTGIIIRVGHDEKVISPRTSVDPLDHYYAIGIRNSFGITIDPITGFMWATENGPEDFDEINLVEPNFNSGWPIVKGPTNNPELLDLSFKDDFFYSNPEFSWERPIAITDLEFANSELFSEYDDILFVGDCNLGNIYQFRLNDERTGFIFNNPNLSDLIMNKTSNENTFGHESIDDILFGTGFGCITDIDFGPNGEMYVVSLSNNIIYRISPT